MRNPFDKFADALIAQYNSEMLRAEVRINEPFCSDRDMNGVFTGSVIYPDQVRLDWVPVTVAIGASVLELTDDFRVQKICLE